MLVVLFTVAFPNVQLRDDELLATHPWGSPHMKV